MLNGFNFSKRSIEDAVSMRVINIQEADALKYRVHTQQKIIIKSYK